MQNPRRVFPCDAKANNLRGEGEQTEEQSSRIVAFVLRCEIGVARCPVPSPVHPKNSYDISHRRVSESYISCMNEMREMLVASIFSQRKFWSGNKFDAWKAWQAIWQKFEDPGILSGK